MQEPKILRAHIYHKRLFPRVNQFGYRLMYLALPLSKLGGLSARPWFAVNGRSILSFWSRDHGDRRGNNLQEWVNRLLVSQDIDDADGEIILVTLPRLFGYVFNPVNFWLCFQKTGELRAVIAEVNNTFGETHSYICANDTGRGISAYDSFYADKEFHVSPFLRRSGYYRFLFDSSDGNFSVRIDYFDDEKRLQLQTSIAATCESWSLSNLFKAWIRSPLMAVKAISLIHWQAVKLVFKSASYKKKPPQHQWFQTRATETVPSTGKEESTISIREEHSCI